MGKRWRDDEWRPHWPVAVVTTGEATSALVPAPAPRRLRTRALAAPPPCRGRRLRTIVSRGAAADGDRVPFQLCPLLSQCLLCSSANFQVLCMKAM